MVIAVIDASCFHLKQAALCSDDCCSIHTPASNLSPEHMLLFDYLSILQSFEKKSTRGGVEITPFEGMPGKGALRQM